MSTLTSGQRQFVSSLAARTNLDPRVLQAWVLAEESGGAAHQREQQGNHNWLNIGYFDSGPGAITKNQAFSNPRSAAHATAEFLQGSKFGASSGIRRILSTAGHDPQAQIKAIAGSGWASSGYAGGSTLRKLFSQFGSQAPSPAGGGQGPMQPQTRTPSTRTVTTQPGVDNSDARRQALSSFLLSQNTDPTTGQQTGGDILGLALQMRQLKDVPAQTATVQAGSAAPKGSSGPSAVSSGGGSGAHAALSWAESKINDPGARETRGENRGQLADFLNQRFGFGAGGAQPWCAMFTSAAVTKGGAPASARTASVAQVRQKAMQGVGYQRGYIPGGQARPGDLILFGNAHIGMVKSNKGGHITYVGGNQSDAVTEGQVPAHGASIVRPKYGARK
jgi:hypothetical protein